MYRPPSLPLEAVEEGIRELAEELAEVIGPERTDDARWCVEGADVKRIAYLLAAAAMDIRVLRRMLELQRTA